MSDTINALCLQCGSSKEGAWKKCPSCNHKPKNDEDMAKHLIVTSHFNPQEKLAEYQSLIQSKKGFQFAQEQVEAVKKIVADKNAKRKAEQAWARNIIFSIIIFIVLGILAYVFS